ncbi:MAG: gliding motility-associated C-terminal domain-containing protein [Bacteroidia bacterium]|nr:gliding motility-associated C-terminal domain-containing protein [Bacteroidia bacterium]
MRTKQTIILWRAFLISLFLAPFSWASSQCVPSPPLDLGPDTAHCGSSFLLDAGPDYATYAWTGGASSSQLQVNNSGTVILQITDTNGCAASDTVNITLLPRPTAITIPSGSVSFCEGGSVNLEANFLGIYAYEWNTGWTSGNLEVNSSGSYYVIVFNSVGCPDTSAPVLVTENPLPDVSIGPDQSICAGDTAVFTSSPSFPVYLWSNGSTQSSIAVTQAGGYALSVRDSNGCSGADTAFVTVNPNPVISIGNDQEFCEGTSTVILSPGNGFASYTWSGGETTPSVTVTSSGLYFVSVTDVNGCSAVSNLVTITINPLPAAPVVTALGTDLTTDPAATYQWYLDGSLIIGANSQSYTPQSSGNYTVLITDQNGCMAQSGNFEVIFEITKDDIYNGISPNGDGINDFFVIGNIERFPDNELVITNRYGSEVFRSTGYTNTWQGRGPDGQSLPDGAYFYVLDLKNGQEPMTGFLQINR